IGVLFVILLFTRRWFTFWMVGFFVINFLFILIFSIGKKSLKIFFNGCFNLAISFLTILIILLTFFYPFFELTFLTDYRDIYSGFRKRDILEHFRGVTETFGYYTLILAILGGYGYLRVKKYYEFAFFLSTTVFLFIFF